MGFLGFGEEGERDLDGGVVAIGCVVGDGFGDQGVDGGVGAREPGCTDAQVLFLVR